MLIVNCKSIYVELWRMIMKKRVCFITPPSPFLLDERVFPSLGVLMVATVVKLSGRFTVSVLDLAGVSNFLEAVETYLATESPMAIGLTVTTPQLPAAVKIIQIIRARAPSIRIILGGPHITLTHTAHIREQNAQNTCGRATDALEKLLHLADVLIAGDGEKAIFLALGDNPPKIINADNPKSDLFLTNQDLSGLPWPDRNLIDTKSYHYTIDGIPAMSLISQLGCPFGCGFCGGRHSPSFRRMRSRTVSGIVAEMEHLYHSFGTRGFMFYDDELNVNQGLIAKLMTAIINLQAKLGTEFRLRGFVKSQLFNDEQARLMYLAGFRVLLTGFESGSPRMLANINKQATVEENTRCVEIAKAHNLKVKALMSLGHPGESRESALATRDWLLAVKPDDFDLSVITVYPGTPYYDEAVPHPSKPEVWVYGRNGDSLFSQNLDYSQVSDFYKGDPNGGYASYVWSEYLTPQEIVELRNEIEKDVRQKLNIPYPGSAQAQRYEHSMGASGLPSHILRSSS